MNFSLMESLHEDKPPVLSGKSTVSSVIGSFEINGNRFILDKEVHNLPRVPKAELERVRYAVAALMIFRCPYAQYSQSAVFDTPDELYVAPESNRIRIYAYNWGQLFSYSEQMKLKMLVPRADEIWSGAMPLYSSPGLPVTTLILDLLTEQEVTRRAASESDAPSGAASAGAAVISSSMSLASSNSTGGGTDTPKCKPLDRESDSGDGGRKRRWGWF